MHTKKELTEQIEDVKTIKSLSETYEEIAAISILQVRNSVSRTREFLAGVSGVYKTTKQVYIKKVQNLLVGKRDMANLSFVRRNGKEVLVFLSANQNLYGDLVFKVFQEFIRDVKVSKNDAVVIGGLGKAYLERENLSSRVEYFDLADYKPEWTKIQDITNFIRAYEKITVYYGEFLSVLNQIPAKSDISGGVTLGEKANPSKDYIFEPSPELVLEFFETQIIANLFHQKVYEAQLARFASRFILMSKAAENATEELGKLNENYLRFKKYLRNKKQLATFSSRVLWGS